MNVAQNALVSGRDARSLGERARQPRPLPALPRGGPPDGRSPSAAMRSGAPARDALELTELGERRRRSRRTPDGSRSALASSRPSRAGCVARAGVALARAPRCGRRSVRPRALGARGARRSRCIGADGNAAERAGNDPASAAAARRALGARARRGMEGVRARRADARRMSQRTPLLRLGGRSSSCARGDSSGSKRWDRHPVRQAESALLYRRENDGARTDR